MTLAPARGRGPARTRPGRPRSARVDEAIMSAALSELADGGYERLTLSGVAEVAGVGRPTIYRRFESKAELVATALVGLSDLPDVALPDHPRDALRALLGATAAAIATSEGMTILGSLLSHERRDPALMEAFRHSVFEPRHAIVRGVLEGAIERGEARAGLDRGMVIDLLFGALLAAALSGETIDERYLDRVIDTVWIAIRKEVP